MPRLLTALLLLGAVVGVACDSDDTDTDAAQQQVREASQNIRQEAREAWAGLRADGDQLVDRVQTRNDPNAKQELLDKCRDAQERLKKEDASGAGQVESFCNKVRDTDVNNNSAWNDIKNQLKDLNERYAQ